MILMIIKMKKHPIDELFASNLRDHSTVPSQRAAELFQKRLAEKERPKGLIAAMPSRKYYWGAAASVLFILGMGWFILQQGEQPTQNVAQNKQELVKATLTNELKPDNSVATVTESREEELQGIAVPELQVARITNRRGAETKKQTQSFLTANISAEESKPAFQPMVLDEPIMDKLTLAVVDAEREKKKEAAKQRKLQNRDNTLFKNSVAETVIVISEVQPKEEQLLIPEISGDSRVSIAQATEMGRERQNTDRSFIAKVFTEIKNLKHGEKLDVAGLSETSSIAFARADEGFIANEKAELSYRLNRLKEVFGKNESR